jgi:hypothetical protein
MLKITLRLLEASALAPMGYLVADIFGYTRIGWALVGAGITCAIVSLSNIIRESRP